MCGYWKNPTPPGAVHATALATMRPRYHETCLALESVEESSAAVSKPRSAWLRMPIVKNLEKARRLPVRQEIQLTARETLVCIRRPRQKL